MPSKGPIKYDARIILGLVEPPVPISLIWFLVESAFEEPHLSNSMKTSYLSFSQEARGKINAFERLLQMDAPLLSMTTSDNLMGAKLVNDYSGNRL